MGSVQETTCDVLVIGGGPAGSTTAARLVADGFDVVLLEKDRHPRFHIGESLLPMNMPLLEELGVMDQVAAIGMPKYGIEFVSPWHDHIVEFHFAKAWDKSNPKAFQVRRSEFDHVLLRNTATTGARVIEGCRVTDIEFLESGGALATSRSDDGEIQQWHAKFVVDATGRDTFLASRFRIKRSNLRHNTAAVFGHFTGAKRLSGQAEGHITIFWFDYGWFWFIPLADGTTSIGAVCRPDYVRTRAADATTFLMNTIALCPALGERLKEARIIEPATFTGNYSYKADRMTGTDYVMVGDSYAFIDPVFSTGVYLAMSSAFRAAEAIKTALRFPEQAVTAMGTYEEETERVLRIFSWYIYRITRPAFRDLFMSPSNVFRIEEAMMSLLAGDVYRQSPIFSRLLLFKGLFYAKTMIGNMRGNKKMPPPPPLMAAE